MTDAQQWLAAADAELDTSGLFCPEPLMLVRKKMRALQAGQTLAVLATDPATGRDLEKFCRFVGHEMLVNITVPEGASLTEARAFQFLIRCAE